jgi:hypothetical protein
VPLPTVRFVTSEKRALGRHFAAIVTSSVSEADTCAILSINTNENMLKDGFLSAYICVCTSEVLVIPVFSSSTKVDSLGL